MNLSNREAIAVYTLLELLKELPESRAIVAKTTAALNEAVRAIEEQPHDDGCDFYRDSDVHIDCTCWKQTALAKINELLK